MAKIDINTILSDEEYTPLVGTVYEVLPGVSGKMKYPTMDLQEKVATAADEEGQSAACRLALDGLPDEPEELGMMASIAVADFLSFALTMGGALKKRYARYESLLKEENQAKSHSE